MKRFYLMLAAALILTRCLVTAQNDLLNLLDNNTEPLINYTSATFKSTRIMNGNSIERMPEGQLDFRISHRFGRLNSGAYNLWGLDQSNVHFSLEYGVTDKIMLGIGRGTYEKTFDGSIKYSLLRQSSGGLNMPVSLSLFASTALNSLKWQDPERKNYFSSRLSYAYQILIARKFNQSFSAQISPTMIHRNLVPAELDPNDLYALGIGGRIKLTKRLSFNAEYYYRINPPNNYPSITTYNPLAVGFDLETGGHVFQLIFTNSLAMIEKGFISETAGRWLKGDIHFGFNISRVFTIKK